MAARTGEINKEAFENMDRSDLLQVVAECKVKRREVQSSAEHDLSESQVQLEVKRVDIELKRMELKRLELEI